jgi:hypothetical protein
MLSLLLITLVVFLFIAALAALWTHSGKRRLQQPTSAAREAYEARESSQAAFVAGIPSQASSLGMESALPFLYATQTAAE